MSAASRAERIEIHDLAHDGRGVGRLDGKTVFVAGALPGETVMIRRQIRHRRHDEARLLEVLTASAERVTPPCAAFGRCGGCALQHLAPAAQVAAKERQLLAELKRIGRVEPETCLAPLTGPTLGYRRRACLGVKFLAREQRVIVGFRARDSAELAALDRCHVLAAPVGELIAALATLIGSLSIARRVPQIEVAIAATATVLVLRVLAPPSAADAERLRDFARQHGLEFWVQPGDEASARPLDAPGSRLRYALAEAALAVEFGPHDFVQVNAALNEAMVSQALALLEVAATDSVLDLYCGLGNFTLPLARRARQVLGVEGEASLVARARANASANGLANIRFAHANLAADLCAESWAGQHFERILLDPPRAGALEVLPLVARSRPRRVVYISCHPGTLARDAGVLVHQHGYRLQALGVMDMFPHTAHVESVAAFEPAR